MAASSKTIVSWIEVIILALLVAGGMGIWLLAGHELGIANKDREPRQEKVRMEKGLPQLEMELAMAQAELKAIQDELVEQRMQLNREENALNVLVETYPQLQTMPAAAEQAAPVDTMDAYMQSRMGQDTTRRLVESLELQLDSLISSTAELSATLSTGAPASPEYYRAQVMLSLAREEMAANQKMLIEQRMLLAQQQAALQAMESAHPQLRNVSEQASRNFSLAPEIVRAYLEAPVKRRTAEALLASLVQEMAEQESRVAARSAVVEEMNRAAEFEFTRQADVFTWSIRWKTLLWSLAGTIVFMVLVGTLVRVIVDTQKVPFHYALVFAGAIAILIILYGYQAFQITGAAVPGALVLIALAGLLTRRRSHHTAT